MKPLALITGASSGIGEAYARALACQTYDLIIVARRADRLQALKAELEAKHGIQVEVLPADLTCDRDIAGVEQRICDAKNLSLLINNAGFDQLGDFVEVPLEKHLGMLKIHLEATIRFCHAALPAMRQRRGGGIINVSSMGGLEPLPQNSLYCATKAGLIMFTKVLAGEEQPHHIAVQVLCPGYTYTEIFDTVGFRGLRVNRIPRFLWMSAEDVVNESLAGLRPGKAVVIPGLANRILYGFLANPIGRRLNRSAWRWLYPKHKQETETTTDQQR
ncbi:MAG: SDR family oxidoreductase [Anaerolineae bacterium]